MAVTYKKGFALLVAVIFTSVILSLGLALASLGYKQAVLASSALQSQYAFYAADSALECALYADQQQDLFSYATYNANAQPLLTCDGTNANTQVLSSCYNEGACPSQLVITERVPLDNGTHCADITIYKPASTGANEIFSQGYNVACSAVGGTSGRFVARGLEAHY